MIFAPLCLAFILIFSSCSAIGGYSEPEDSLVAMAIGFDREGDALRVSIQLSSGGDGYRTAVGEGADVESAIGSIMSGESKTLEYSHVGIVALGRGLYADDVADILKFCNSSKEISLSARLISTFDASLLLSADGFGGYEMVAMLTSGIGSPISADSRLYLAYRTERGSEDLLALPYFASNGDGFELYGVRIFREGEGLIILGRDEAEMYMMMRNSLVGEGKFGQAKTTYSLKKTDNGDVLTVTAHLSSTDGAPLSLICEKMGELYVGIYERHGDIFGYIERVRKLGGGEEFSVKFECKERGK